MPIGDDGTNRVRGTARESSTPTEALREPEPYSIYRALQTSPLSRLASNGSEQAHVRTSAILGYN